MRTAATLIAPGQITVPLLQGGCHRSAQIVHAPRYERRGAFPERRSGLDAGIHYGSIKGGLRLRPPGKGGAERSRKDEHPFGSPRFK